MDICDPFGYKDGQREHVIYVTPFSYKDGLNQHVIYVTPLVTKMA